MQNATQNTTPATQQTMVAQQAHTTPAMPNTQGHLAMYAQAQAQKAQQAQAKAQAQAQAQAQRLANATYVLVKPSKANITRTKQNATPAQQAQTNANLAATLILQLQPLVAQSGLTPAQQTQVAHALLQSIYTLQIAANIAPSKQAVQQVLP